MNVLKSFSTIITFVVILSGCTKKDNHVVTPQTTGNGILSGKTGLLIMEPKDPFYIDKSNTIVSIVGTAISTTTDSKGNWTIHGVDSGSYTLRFSHDGFEPIEISNIVSNGQDSVYVNYKATHPSGATIEVSAVNLLEQSAEVSATANATLKQVIAEERDQYDTTIIRRDTTFIYNATITTENNTLISWTKENLPVKVFYMLSEKPTLASTDFPVDSNFRNTNWKEVGDLNVHPGTTSKRDFVIANNSVLKSLERNRQYYLHILPLWTYLKQWILLYHDTDAYLSLGEATKWGSVVSIPIEWK